jgi:hypothetical protein
MRIELKNGIYEGATHKVTVRSENGHVIVFIDESRVEFKTPAAFKAGFAIVKKAGLALTGDFVSWTVNGKEIQMLPEHALKIGGAILRKTEDADDFQLNRSRIRA